MMKKYKIGLSIVLFTLLKSAAIAQILVSGTSFDPLPGNENRYYIGIDDIEQVGIQSGIFNVPIDIAASVDPDDFHRSHEYAITDNAIKLDSARYVDKPLDYQFVFSPGGSATRLIEYTISGLEPGSNVEAEIEYCTPMSSTGTENCVGQRVSFKGGVNPQNDSQNEGLESTQLQADQESCNDHTIASGAGNHSQVVDANGRAKFFINSLQNSDCGALSIKSIMVYGIPKPVISSSQGDAVCAGEIVTIKPSNNYDAPYQWQINSGGSWQDIPGETNETLLYETDATPQTYEFRLKITPGGQDFFSESISVEGEQCCEINGASASRQTVFYDNFGRVDLNNPRNFYVWDYTDIYNPEEVLEVTSQDYRRELSNGPVGLNFAATGPVNDGWYSVAANLVDVDFSYWSHNVTGYNAANRPKIGLDHSGERDGAVLLINNNNNLGDVIYSRSFNNLCGTTGGRIFNFEFYLTVFTDGNQGADVTVNLRDPSNPANDVSFNATAVKRGQVGNTGWTRFSSDILIEGTSLEMEIINNVANYTDGNDVAIDDIKISTCAPPSVNLFYDLSTLSQSEEVCLDPINLVTQTTQMLDNYYSGNQEYQFQWTLNPTDYTSWKYYGTPQSNETYPISIPKDDIAFSGLDNGDKVYFRVVVANPGAFPPENDVNINNPCRSYSVSPPIEATLDCPSCTEPDQLDISFNANPVSDGDAIVVCEGTPIEIDITAGWPAVDPSATDELIELIITPPTGSPITDDEPNGKTITSINYDYDITTAQVLPAISGTYKVEVRNTTGCVLSKTFDLTVTPTPASLTVSTPQEYCQDEAGTLEVPTAGTGNSLVWYTAATGGTGSSTTPTVVTTTAGSPVATHYVAQQTSTTTGSCLSDRSAIEVNVTATPDVSVTDPSGVCSPLTVDLSTVWSDVNTSGGTAAYEYSSDGTVFTSITNTAAAVVADSGLYRVIVTNGTCADTANINVEIYSLPVLSLGFSPNDTVCVGTEVTLSDLNYTTGNSYVWSMSGSGTTEEEKVTPSTDLLFNVEVTDGNGCVSTADSVVRVDAAPDLVAPQGDMEVCATTATLPQVTPSVGTGVWSKLSTSTSGTIVDVTDPSTQVTGISPGTFIDAKWTVSNGVCPDVTDTVRVSSLTAINPVVNVNTPLSFNVCEDSDTTIIATGSSAGTYEYYVTGTPSSVLGTDSILDVTNITTVQQITVSFTATECVASGATNPVTKDIVITPMTAPTATITGFADGATYIFNELPGTVTGTAPGTGYDYSWEANPSTKGSANLLDYGFNSTMAYDDVVNLDFIVRNSGGECPSDTAHLEVIRKDITTAEALNDTICVTGGNNYTQTPQNLPNTSNNEQAEWLALVGSPTPSAGTGLDVTLTSKGEYGYVYRIYNPTVLDANSKPIESRDTVMIVVDAEVVGPVSAGVATDVCTDTVSLSGTGLSTGESGFWTGPSGLIFTEATSPTSQVTNFTDGVSHTLTWTKYSEYGVCPSVSGTVNLNKLSSVTAAAITGEDTLDVCLGDPVVLYSNAALASNNETGIWSSTDISLPSTSLNSTTLDITSEITSSAEGNYKLKWTISSTSCPTGSVDSVIVAVSGKPSQPSITGLPTMCEDSTATYTISSDPKATLGYVWSVKGQGSVVGTDTSGVVKFDRQLALTDAQKETVWVYAQSMNVCGGSEKDSMEVIIDLAPRQADYVAPSTSLSLQSDLTSICETTSGEVLEVTTPTGNNATKYRWMVEGTRLGNETTVPLSNQFDASDIPGFSDGSVVNMEVLFGNACGYYGAISDIAVTLVSKNDLEIDLSLANEIALDSVTSRELYAICSLDDSYSIKVEGQGVDLTGTDIVYDLIIDGELVLSDFPSNQLDGSLLLPSAKLPDGIVEVTAEISDPTKGCFTSPAIDSDQISLRDYSFEKFDIVGNKLICESDADLSLSLSIPQDTKDKKHNKIERAIWRFEDGSEMYGTTIEIGDPSKAGEVSLELINVNGCQTFNSEPEINPIEVVIDEKPVIVIEGKPVITVPVDVNNELPEYQLSSYVTNLNASEYTSNWGAESITSKLTESEILSWLSSTSVINPVIDPLDEDVARLIVTVVNGACETKDSIDIRATKPFMPPTAFTPNGDGLNDSWVVEGLTAYNKAVMKIYNRWGQLVFEKYGGYYDQFDGKNLPMATYYWTVEFNEPDKAPESGTVTILK